MPKMTNLEKIRGMSDYELSVLIYRLTDCENRIYCDGCPLYGECDMNLQPVGWLEEPVASITNITVKN